MNTALNRRTTTDTTRASGNPNFWSRIAPLIAIPAIVITFAACDSSRNQGSVEPDCPRGGDPLEVREIPLPGAAVDKVQSTEGAIPSSVQDASASSEEGHASGDPPKLGPYQRQSELFNSRKRLLSKLKELRGTEPGTRYREALEHLSESRFSNGTKMYPGIADVLVTGYPGERDFPRLFAVHIADMSNVSELMELAPGSAVSIMHAFLNPEKVEQRYGIKGGISQEESEELARLFANFFKVTNPTDASALDGAMARALSDFEGYTKGPNDYAGWKNSGVPDILSPKRARKFLVDSATFGRFNEYGIGPENPGDSDQRLRFRRELEQAMER